MWIWAFLRNTLGNALGMQNKNHQDLRVLPGSLTCNYIHSGGMTMPLTKKHITHVGKPWMRGFTVKNSGSTTLLGGKPNPGWWFGT